MELGHLAAARADTLSGGQKKLLELARALMSDPRIILLDEPGAGVNPTLLRSLVGAIRALRAAGRTFLLIEHDMDLVTELCDPVVVMSQGRKLTEGPFAEIRRDPRVLEAYLGTAPVTALLEVQDLPPATATVTSFAASRFASITASWSPSSARTAPGSRRS